MQPGIIRQGKQFNKGTSFQNKPELSDPANLQKTHFLKLSGLFAFQLAEDGMVDCLMFGSLDERLPNIF